MSEAPFSDSQGLHREDHMPPERQSIEHPADQSTAESLMDEVIQLSQDVQKFLDKLASEEQMWRQRVIEDISKLRSRAEEATQRYKRDNNPAESNSSSPMPQFHHPPAEIITGHLSHPSHNLRLAADTETDTDGHWPSRCGGCKELAAGRIYYKCEVPTCNFTLHMCCATAPLTLDHPPLFPRCEFRLLKRPPPPPPWLAECGRACDACGDLLHSDGLAYRCSEHGLDLHPRCARLPAAAEPRDVADSGGYKVELRSKVASGGRCGICMSGGEDGYRDGFWCYRFSGEGKVFDLHLSCLKELASQSHRTLTKFYEILMGEGHLLWMPTKDWGEGTSDEQVNNNCDKNMAKRPAPEEGDAESQTYQNGVNNTTVVPDTITHPSHPKHKLRMVTCDTPFKCNGCLEPGDGTRYHCHACDLNIHKFCAEAPATLRLNLFEGRTFTLLFEPPPGPPEPPHPAADGRWCDTCGDPVKGLVYHCSGANLDLHPCCASLYLQVVAGPGPVPGLCGWHVGRKPRPLAVDGFTFDIKASRKCILCEEDKGRREWCYYCSDIVDGEEEVCLHVACVKRIARRRWQLGLDSKCGGQIMLVSEEIMREEGPLISSIASSETARRIVGAAVRVIVAVIFGDSTAIEEDVGNRVALNLPWLTYLFSSQS